jgi:hypothetical protein
MRLERRLRKILLRRAAEARILIEPTKITLMTDFLKSISKNTYVPCLEKLPDPNVIEEMGGHVK